MATLSELVESVAKVEGMDPTTVGLIARNVREAGLISTRGRGRSAAIMNSADAANLLIAVNVAGTVREAAQAVRNYRRLEVSKLRARLGDALEQLIEAASNNALPQLFLSNPVPRLVAQGFLEGQIDVEFTFHKPTLRATLSISAPTDLPAIEVKADGWHAEEGAVELLVNNATCISFEFDPPSDQIKRQPKKYFGDRRDTTSIGYPTIRAVGELLAIVGNPPRWVIRQFAR